MRSFTNRCSTPFVHTFHVDKRTVTCWIYVLIYIRYKTPARFTYASECRASLVCCYFFVFTTIHYDG